MRLLQIRSIHKSANNWSYVLSLNLKVSHVVRTVGITNLSPKFSRPCKNTRDWCIPVKIHPIFSVSGQRVMLREGYSHVSDGDLAQLKDLNS